MKRFSLFFSMLFLLTAPALAAVTAGQPAPDFTGTSASGESITLSSFRGRTVILEWTNHECPYVVKHYGSNNMQDMQRDMTGKGMVWLSIVSSADGKQGHVTPERANALTASRNAAPTAVILDEKGEIGRLYGARTTPHMFVINAEGQVVYAGAIDSISSADQADVTRATNYVKAAVASMEAGQPILVASSEPYGCSVKY